MANAKPGRSGCPMIKVDGERVSLSVEGLKRAHGREAQVGQKMVEAVRSAVERATGGDSES